jgi:hypothetical protein
MHKSNGSSSTNNNDKFHLMTFMVVLSAGETEEIKGLKSIVCLFLNILQVLTSDA